MVKKESAGGIQRRVNQERRRERDNEIVFVSRSVINKLLR